MPAPAKDAPANEAPEQGNPPKMGFVLVLYIVVLVGMLTFIISDLCLVMNVYFSGCVSVSILESCIDRKRVI